MSPSYRSPLKNKCSSRLIIFDFDGVLADSFNAFYPLIRDGMAHVGLRLTQKQYRGFFAGNVHAGFKKFIKDKQKYSAFLEFRKLNYDKYYQGVRIFPKANKVLKKLSRDYFLTIASSGQKKNILNLLEQNSLAKFFPLILTDAAYTKEGMIKEILAKFKVKPRETLMITDTAGDLKTAKKAGLKTVAVSWGFHPRSWLKSAKPDHIVNNFEMLYKKLR